jgi:hypothetical protein
MIVEFEQTGSTDFVSYFFVHSFTTDGTPDDIDLQIKVDGGSALRIDQMSMFVLDLDAIGTEGTDYFEDIQAVDTGTEYSTSTATTVLSQLSGADLGTDEHLVLGYARTDVGSTGRWYRIQHFYAEDASSSTVKTSIYAEGEDTAEQRITGVAFRHKASSGTPNVTMYGQEEAANGNMTDGGAYMIALPSALFADMEYTYSAANVSVDGTETTIATIASYTPTTNGNHLVLGTANGSNTPTALGGMWVEEGTTEIRTGDAAPTHNQIWDNAKDNEVMNTFQRYSITSTVTLNLRAQGAGTDFDVSNRHLLIVNLNEPDTGPTVYPPFPRVQQTTVRM